MTYKVVARFGDYLLLRSGSKFNIEDKNNRRLFRSDLTVDVALQELALKLDPQLENYKLYKNSLLNINTALAESGVSDNEEV